MRDHEFRLLRNAGDTLASILKEIHAIRDEQKAEQQRERVPPEPAIVQAELQIPECIQRENRTNSDRNYRVQQWLTVGTWLAFLAAAIYAGIAEHTRRATVEAVKQAKRSNDLNERLVKGTYAAIFEAQAQLTDGTVNLMFTNSGKVTSAKLKATTRITPESIPDYKPIRESQTVTINGSQIAAGGLAQTIEQLDGFTQADIDRMAVWKEAVAIEGTVTYDNGFGDLVSKPFCFLDVRWPTGDGKLTIRPVPCDTAKEFVRTGPELLRNTKKK